MSSRVHFESMDTRLTMWLRAEGFFVLLLCLVLYREVGLGWTLFAVLLLVPDLSILGYLRSPRVGAAAYNLFHSYVPPTILALAGLSLQRADLPALGLIWAAHIGLDRMLGYGLKRETGFGDTHLGTIGAARRFRSPDTPPEDRFRG